MQAGSSGLFAWFATQGDDHPLVLGVAAFVLISLCVNHWHMRGEPKVAAPAGLKPPQRIARFGLAVIALFLATIFARRVLVELYRVVSPSMMPTLKVRDRLIVNKLAYGAKIPFTERRIGGHIPQRGDVIVFPGDEQRMGRPSPGFLVKRVIGVPGDYIAFDAGRLIVNNWTVPTCDAGPFAAVVGNVAIRGRLSVEFLGNQVYLTVTTPGGASFPGYRVLPGEVFVVGDDRGISSDSRIWNTGEGGGVRIDSIAGRVSHLLGGVNGDGRIDLWHPVRALSATVREPALDLRTTSSMIAACLRNRPSRTWPPPPSGS